MSQRDLSAGEEETRVMKRKMEPAKQWQENREKLSHFFLLRGENVIKELKNKASNKKNSFLKWCSHTFLTSEPQLVNFSFVIKRPGEVSTFSR